LLANFIFHDENEGFATDFEGKSKNCRKLRQLSQEEEITIDFSQLPQAAQTTVKKEFPSHQIAFTTQEGILSKTYEVHFSNGDKIEFDSKGNWDNVSMKSGPVPATFIPAAIDKFVKAKYPNTFIKKIDKDRRDTEIELSNGLDLKFNKNYKLIEIDD